MTDASSAGTVPAPGPRLAATFHGALTAIWMRELRGRMRGKRAFIFITIYLAFLVALLWTVLRASLEAASLGAVEQVLVGRAIFIGVIFIETLVVVALAPAYTAGLISSELEKQTFDLLAATPISSVAIVVGKLFSGLSYLVLLVAVSIPIASLAFFFGGLAVETLLLGYLLLFVTAVGIGTIGIACSAIMRRTQPATVAAFMTVALVVVGASDRRVMTDRARVDEQLSPPPEALLYLNPFLAQPDLLCEAPAHVPRRAGAMPRTQSVLMPVRRAAAGAAGACAGGRRRRCRRRRFWPKVAISWILVSGA